MSLRVLKIWFALAICLVGLMSSAYGACDPSTATQVGSGTASQTVTLTPSNTAYTSGVTYTYLWTVNHYVHGTTTNPTQIRVHYNGQDVYQVVSSAAPSSLPVTFTIPSNTPTDDYYTVELEIQASSACIDDLCIGKIVVAGSSVSIKQNGQTPATEICYTSDPATKHITYTAVYTGSSPSFQWWMDSGTPAAGSNTYTVFWENYVGAPHTIHVQITNAAGETATASAGPITAYPKPAIGTVGVSVA